MIKNIVIMYICSKEITTFKMIGIFRLLLVGTISVTHFRSSLATYVKSLKVVLTHLRENKPECVLKSRKGKGDISSTLTFKSEKKKSEASKE